MRLRRLLTLLFLATALVLGQQGAALHALSHFGEELSSEEGKQAGHGGACDQCVAYAGFAGALPGSDAVPPPEAARSARLEPGAERFATSDPRLSRVRDPPVFL
jgi:hypothetical protein